MAHRYEVPQEDGGTKKVTLLNGRAEIKPTEILERMGIEIGAQGSSLKIGPTEGDLKENGPGLNFMTKMKVGAIPQLAEENGMNMTRSNHRGEITLSKGPKTKISEFAAGLVALAMADKGPMGDKIREFMNTNGVENNAAGQAFQEVAPDGAYNQSVDCALALEGRAMQACADIAEKQTQARRETFGCR